jgi:hypothetical protein
MKMQLTGGGVVALAGVAAVAGLVIFIAKKLPDIKEAVNPMDENNLASRAAKSIVGEERLASVSEKVFGGIDLLNPFNESDDYAWTLFDEQFAPVKKAAEKVNPASQNNVVNQGVEKLLGSSNVSKGADYFFGAIDLLNPWNESDEYAQKVYGLNK